MQPKQILALLYCGGGSTLLLVHKFIFHHPQTFGLCFSDHARPIFSRFHRLKDGTLTKLLSSDFNPKLKIRKIFAKRIHFIFQFISLMAEVKNSGEKKPDLLTNTSTHKAFNHFIRASSLEIAITVNSVLQRNVPIFLQYSNLFKSCESC